MNLCYYIIFIQEIKYNKANAKVSITFYQEKTKYKQL